MPRFLSRFFAATVIVLSLGIFLKLIWSTDPEGRVFLQAGRLEASGQVTRALEHYQLIAARHPKSSYAPRALMRVGDLLSAQGRQNGDKSALRRSVAAYVQLARAYPKDPFVLTALQNAGTLAAEQLSDRPLARSIYNQIIKLNARSPEIVAGATVKIARLDIQDGEGDRAKDLLQDVLRRWGKNASVGSEAQYFLGVCYETVFRKRDWATRAYDLVIAQFPGSQWAADARGRLGLLVFADSQGRRPTRRVWLDIPALPDEEPVEGEDEGALWDALRLALASRGLSGDTTLLRGYALLPFSAGLSLDNPSEVIGSQADAWQNVAGAAGFRFSIKGNGREEEALRELQNELDAAHLPLVCWQNEGKTVWSLVVGYDSERGEVMLQNRGAQFDTLAAKTWAPKWKVQSPFGKNYTLISLVPPGKTATPNPKLTPTPAPTTEPNQTPAPVVNGPPTFVWQIAPLSERVPIERTARRAGMLLLQSGTNERILNARALDFLAQTLDGAAREARSSAPVVQPTPTQAPQPSATEGVDNSIYDPTPTPAPGERVPASTPRELLARAQALWPFWNAPAAAWISKRREAASWCRLAALKTRDTRFNRAADAFEQCAGALEKATQSALSLSPETLGTNASVLENLARQCRLARDAERSAAQLLG